MNFKMGVTKFIITSIILFSFVGCKKDEGVGGTSTITGKVFVHDYDASFQVLSATYPKTEQDVYIIYGDGHSTYDDNYKTSYDGTFEFKYLQKGKYKLFVYVKDTTGASVGNYNTNAPKIPVFVNVEITSNGSVVSAPDLFYLDNKQ